ncbi:MAG: DUF262 domain-containing protein [Lachnospiraceae bacterium]|nr:DUF262 domain-containing protein [Lachnospiraceae bacterium]
MNIRNDLKGISIQQYKTDIGFRTLVEGVDENLYIIPKYQRKYRWRKEQVIALVESLIRGLPIPPIYTCRNQENQLEILDGQQRILSLFFYYIGYYLDRKKNNSVDFSEIPTENGSFKDALSSQLALEELHIQLKNEDEQGFNVDYANLPPEMKRRIDYTTITVIEIKIDDEKQRTKILRKIFENLNAKGSLLTQQELRNGIYVCDFYHMLQKYNRHDDKWRKIWGREDAAERDMETLLRLCALKMYVKLEKKDSGNFDFIIENYHSSYAKLLDQFSEDAMKFDEEQMNNYKNSLDCFFELFKVNVTHSSKVALLESFYIVYEKLAVNKAITSEIYNKILHDPRYISYARQGTVKMKNMNERWKTVYEIWSGDSKSNH